MLAQNFVKDIGLSHSGNESNLWIILDPFSIVNFSKKQILIEQNIKVLPLNLKIIYSGYYIL